MRNKKGLPDTMVHNPFYCSVRNGLLRSISARDAMIVICIALFITYRLAANYILNHMYSVGTRTDTFFISPVIWRNGWDLYCIWANASTFKIHLYLILWLPTFISHFLPIDRIPYLADCMGVAFAFLTLIFIVCLNALWPARELWAVVLKALAGVAFAFNPIAEQILSEAHPEIMGVAMVLLFLVALALRRHGWACIALALAMSVREDMGFHIFGLLFIVIATDVLRGIPFRQWKYTGYYALAALAYSIAALLVIYLVIGPYGTFRIVYLGTPAYAHVTAALMEARLSHFFHYCPYIWFPALVSFVWAVGSDTSCDSLPE